MVKKNVQKISCAPYVRACDERGLTQIQRCRFDMSIEYAVMPWHRTHYDLSLMEVNHVYSTPVSMWDGALYITVVASRFCALLLTVPIQQLLSNDFGC